MADFERCTARLAALRAVQMKILRSVLALLSSDVLRSEVAAMQSAMGARPYELIVAKWPAPGAAMDAVAAQGKKK